MDGQGNNLDQPTWGMAGTALLKLAPTSYADGISMPTTSRPNARTVSNLVFAQSESVPNSSGPVTSCGNGASSSTMTLP